jgi:predicted lipoprotein with Yx(FWY)xxD motif
MASRGQGDWTVNASSESPQWNWRGKPVYVSTEADPKQVPAGAEVLRP